MRRVDPWGLAVAAIGAVVFMLQGFGGVLSRDLALYAYAGQQFAEGVPPYVAVLNRAGPLAHMVPGFGAMVARELGTDELLTMRVMMLVLTVVAVWVTYLAGRDLFGSRAAGAAAAATLLASRAVVLYAGGGPREKTTMVLLVACAMLAIVHRRWGWAGAATAMATLTWQPAFWPCLAAAMIAAKVPPWRAHWRSTILAWSWFAAGGIAATGAMVGYFAAVGSLDAFFEGFLFVNATSTDQVGLITFLIALPDVMLRAWGWSLWMVLAGLLASVVLAWRSRGSTDPTARAVVGVGAGTVAALAWSIYVFNGWADAIFAVPLAALGIAGLVAGLRRRFSARSAVAVAVAYVLLVSVSAGITAWNRRPDVLEPMRAETQALLAAAGPDATVQSVGAPQALVLGGLRNPIRHQMFLQGLDEYVDTTEPEGLAGIANDIGQRRPTFVTMDHPSWYDWMHPVLDRSYRRIGTTAGFTWYADRDLGAEELDRLGDILAGKP
ncbi:MAG: hypothetical protein WA966_03855 [Ornithinimicrobium sp.]